MRTRSPYFSGLARAFALVALVSCSDDGREALETQPGATRTRDAGTSDAPAATDASVPEPEFGWRSDWFDLFADRKASRVDAAIGITRPTGIRETLYSTRFAAKVKVATGGEHTFDATSDDGLRVFVDGEAVIDDWTPHAPKTHSEKVTLEAGEHDVRVEYFQLHGGATLTFGVTPAFAEIRPTATTDDGPRPTFTNPV